MYTLQYFPRTNSLVLVLCLDRLGSNNDLYCNFREFSLLFLFSIFFSSLFSISSYNQNFFTQLELL